MNDIKENKTIFQICIDLNDDIEALKKSRKKLLDLNPSWNYLYIQSQDHLDQIMIDNFEKSNDEFEYNIYKLYSEIPNLNNGGPKSAKINDPIEKERIRSICALVSRTDIFRLGMIYKFGGFYLDLSSKLEINIDSELTRYDCAFIRSFAEIRSSFIYAIKGHYVIKKILDTAIHRGLIEKCRSQMQLAGPICITDTIEKIANISITGLNNNVDLDELVEYKTKIFGEGGWGAKVGWRMNSTWKRDLHKQPDNNPNKKINDHWIF